MAFTAQSLALFSVLSAHLVAAQSPGLHPDPECLQGKIYPVNGYPACVDSPREEDFSGTFPQDEFGDFIVYVDGTSIPDGDKVVFVDLDDPVLDECGTPRYVIDSQTRCQLAHLPFALDFIWCSERDGEDCDDVIPTRLLGNTTAVTDTRRRHARDMLLSNPKKRQDDCSFSGGDVYEKYGETQRLTNALRCPQGSTESCQQSVQISRSVSQTNSFGVSTEVGASFFEVVSVSVSFSYEYSYTEEESQSTSYTVTINAGMDVYLTWTPTLECVDGEFAGSCDGWDTDTSGEVCIPKMLGQGGSGEPAGEYNVITELSPQP
jgi:hypothetical protein